VAIVNEAFVRLHFPGEDPIGKGFGEGGETWQIVGVVGDLRMRGLAAPTRPMMYRPLAASPFPDRTLVARTSAPPGTLIEPIRRAVLEADPEQPVANARTLEEVVARSVAQRRLVLGVLVLFAGGALLLAGIGLYGVVAYVVSQRTREIGVRMAVGASRRDVLGLFVGQGMRLAAVGIVLGVAGSAGLTRLLASQLYGVQPTDPATFASVALLLAAVTFAACWLPARRAARLDPMSALR
jgi:putative ABC transport system permease protein